MKNKKKVQTKKSENKKKQKKFLIFLISLLVVFSVAAIGSIFTSSSVNTEWYSSIKPSITPPNYVFPIVWNILFFLIALSLYFSWVYSSKKEKPKIILVYSINLFLNILWSILYFGLKNPALAFFELIIFFFSILIMILVSYKIKKVSSYLLIPYLLWVGFASFLNYLSAFS
jgi:tryptophan-rich sensory protein